MSWAGSAGGVALFCQLAFAALLALATFGDFITLTFFTGALVRAARGPLAGLACAAQLIAWAITPGVEKNIGEGAVLAGRNALLEVGVFSERAGLTAGAVRLRPEPGRTWATVRRQPIINVILHGISRVRACLALQAGASVRVVPSYGAVLALVGSALFLVARFAWRTLRRDLTR